MIVRWLLSSAFLVLYAHGWRGCAKGFPHKLQSPHRQTKYLSLTSPDTADNYFAWARFATDQKSLSFLAGFIGGAASRVTKEIVLHPIDTVRARIQGAKRNESNSFGLVYRDANLFANLYDGILPSIIGGIPAGAVFFGVKDYTKVLLKETGLFDQQVVAILSVALANIPYWIIRNPSEVLKTRDQIEKYEEGGIEKFSSSVIGKPSSIQLLLLQAYDLYASYGTNLIYALPADIIKFLTYENIVSVVFHSEGKLQGLQAAEAGAAASFIAQLLTTPLDVVRTRVMLSSTSDPILIARDIFQNEGTGCFFRGTVPRLLRALLSGAVQFATYEVARNVLQGQ